MIRLASRWKLIVRGNCTLKKEESIGLTCFHSHTSVQMGSIRQDRLYRWCSRFSPDRPRVLFQNQGERVKYTFGLLYLLV